MQEIDMAAVQAVELDLLKAVAALCEKHGLRYTLYCGTLLGAVRHGGFIPWDDDVDIAMPLKDYRRFQKVSGELPARFVCKFYGNCPDYYFPWMKVYAEGTTFMEVSHWPLDVPEGISMDIYPFIGAAETAWGFKIQLGLIRLAHKLHAVVLDRLKKDKRLFIRLLYWTPYPVRRAVSCLLWRMAMRDPDTCKRIGTIDGVPFSGKFAREDWKELIRMRFEDAQFWAPANYDKILRIMYGDYMELPPENSRRGHNDSDGRFIIDPKRDYREYKRELNSQ